MKKARKPRRPPLSMHEVVVAIDRLKQQAHDWSQSGEDTDDFDSLHDAAVANRVERR